MRDNKPTSQRDFPHFIEYEIYIPLMKKTAVKEMYLKFPTLPCRYMENRHRATRLHEHVTFVFCVGLCISQSSMLEGMYKSR